MNAAAAYPSDSRDICSSWNWGQLTDKGATSVGGMGSGLSAVGVVYIGG